MNEKEKSLPFLRQISLLRWPFWVVNIMEMIERMAYYGVRVVIPIYIAQADEPGGLHFTQEQKGLILMVWAFVQSTLPVFTGGFADRYGYKKQVALAIAVKAAGYVVMGTQREFWPFFAGCILLAAGTAVFKPPIQGTMAKTFTRETSGAAWGIFYMIVNVGAFLGPPLAHYLCGFSWPHVFLGCAVLVSLNCFWLLSYKAVDSEADKTTGALNVAWMTVKNLLNPALLIFVLIMSALWACFTQLWDMLPNFIVDWVDSSALAVHLPQFMLSGELERGPQIAQEWVINMNPFLIVLFVVPVSWYVNRKMRRLTSIFFGILLGGTGILVVGSHMSIYICLLGIAVFSLGEMLSSPKMNEYLAVIAPKDQKGLYMGYANIPFAIGWSYGAFLGGNVYGEWGEKATLALRYLSEKLNVTEGRLPERTDAFDVLCERLGTDATQATQLLWHTYHPNYVWLPFAAMGGVAAVGMLAYGWWIKRHERANA